MSIFKSIFSAIGGAATAVGHFFAKAFTWVETDGAKAAVAIVEETGTLMASGAVDFVAQILDGLTKTQIPTEIVADIKAKLPGILSDLLAVENLGASPTEAQEQAFAQQLLTSFGVLADKSEFYSTLTAKLISIIRANTMPGQTFTFAVLINDGEEAYQAYLAAKAAEAQADQTNP